jgi:hypothetical protein
VALQKGKIPLAALLDYSHALAAVTNAADRAAYDAAVAKLADSLKGLASAAGPSGAGMGTAVAAGVNILGWLVGTALDQQRFDSLKAAVNAVGMRPADGGDTPMKVITNAIGDGLEVANYQRLNTLNDEMNGDRVRLGPSLTDAAYRQRLDDALALATSIQALREADPRGTTDALNAAHEALVKAVNDPSRNLPALVKALTDFSDKAQALQTATSKAAAPQKGT